MEDTYINITKHEPYRVDCPLCREKDKRIQELEEALQVLINNIKAEHRGGKLAEHSILVRQSIKHAKEVLRTP